MVQKINLDMVDGLTTALGGKATTTGVTAEIAAAIAALPPVTAWVAYTPVITGFGTVSGVDFQSRRVGGNLEVIGRFTSGTSTSVTAQIGLGFNGTPGGLSISNILNTRSVVGSGAVDVATAEGQIILALAADTTVNIGKQNAATGGMATALGVNVLSTGTTLACNFSVPIQGW